MFRVVRYRSSSKLKDKQYKQKTSPKGHKTEIKILANPQQPSPGYNKLGSQPIKSLKSYNKALNFTSPRTKSHFGNIWNRLSLRLDLARPKSGAPDHNN